MADDISQEEKRLHATRACEKYRRHGIPPLAARFSADDVAVSFSRRYANSSKPSHATYLRPGYQWPVARRRRPGMGIRLGYVRGTFEGIARGDACGRRLKVCHGRCCAVRMHGLGIPWGLVAIRWVRVPCVVRRSVESMRSAWASSPRTTRCVGQQFGVGMPSTDRLVMRDVPDAAAWLCDNVLHDATMSAQSPTMLADGSGRLSRRFARWPKCAPRAVVRLSQSINERQDPPDKRSIGLAVQE